VKDIDLVQYRLNLGHPEDRNLGALELVEHSIEAQLEFEHLLIERDKREIELAKCFPDGKLILRGKMRGPFRTIDPEVSRSFLIENGKQTAILYINTLRKVCVAIDWNY
jgi:hypothetical protein